MAADKAASGGRGRLRDLIRVGGPAIIVTMLGFVLAYQFVGPAPPKRVVIATGARDGAYFAFAGKYRAILAKEGIELVVRPTAGSVENLALLQDAKNGVDVALVQGGIGTPGSHPGLVSLGSLYFEPLWLFTRLRELEDLLPLVGARIAVGPEGSGTRAVALRLLAENGLDKDNVRLMPLGAGAGAAALRAGTVEAVFFVGSAAAPVVRRLFAVPGVYLANFRRSEAYARRFRFLSAVSLPEGVLDFAGNVPDREILLLAPAATLVASPGLHPALVQLLMRAATATHREGGLFERAGEFPSLDFTDFPVSPDARRYIDSGPTLLQRFLPFWAADLIDRLKIMLLPLLTLLYPLVKALPPAYKWRMQSRIIRWYKELQAIEERIDADATAQAGAHLRSLDRIEDEVRRLAVPASYVDRIYTLRHHIGLVRARLGGSDRSV